MKRKNLTIAEALGDKLQGIRTGYTRAGWGNSRELVKEIRAKLDLAGYNHVKIFVSGGLDPERIKVLKEATRFLVSSYISGARAIDMTMDLKVDGKPVAKREIPGITSSERLVKVK